jgi:phosphate transport system permease protein
MTDAAANALPSTRNRKISMVAFRVFTYLALLFVLAPAIWILGSVVAHAVPHWQWSVLTASLNADSTSGGLRDQILGTLILMLGVLIVAGSVGVLGGLYLAELARPKRPVTRLIVNVLRMASDVLSGFPSIVLGYVGYTALVVGLHWEFSLLPAVLVLSVMVVPYIAKTTENSLRQVPTGYREGAAALGMTMGYALRKVVFKSALPGIVTGLLLALAIACGETAPLIYTAGFGNHLTGHLTGSGAQFPYLTYVVFKFFDQPNVQAHYLSYDADLILVVIVLLLLVSSRIIVARTQRHTDGARIRDARGRRSFWRRFTKPTGIGAADVFPQKF